MISVCGIRKKKLSNHKAAIRQHDKEKKDYSTLQVGSKVACMIRKENKKYKQLVGIVNSLDHGNKMAEILRPNKTKTDMLFQDLVLLPDN